MLRENKIWKEAESSWLMEYIIIPYSKPYFTVCRYKFFFCHVVFQWCETLVFEIATEVLNLYEVRSYRVTLPIRFQSYWSQFFIIKKIIFNSNSCHSFIFVHLYSNKFRICEMKKNYNCHKVPHTPTQRFVTAQVSFYRKKNIMEVPEVRWKSLHLQRALTSKIVEHNIVHFCNVIHLCLKF